MRALVLILGCLARPYPSLIKTIRRTWASVVVEDVSLLFYYGGDRLAVTADELFLPVADDLAHVGHKTLACFEYVLEHREFDLIFRTNCSSYVDLPGLRNYVEQSCERFGFYAGSLAVHDSIPFASGSGFFLTRDLVELVVKLQSDWNHALIDDVALAELLGRRGISPRPTPRVDVRDIDEARRIDTSQFHFRCKTGGRGRRGDMDIFHEIHRSFGRTHSTPRLRRLRRRLRSLAARS